MREYLAGRGLGEEISREFRLGLSPGRGLAAKAKEKGFTLDELRGAGLATVRGGDYFPQRLMFPLCDARGRVVGFQARKLHDDDPLRGKYVNSPEGDLFKKSAILYGLHLARTAISKQDRAAVVEGNTDVIALRQAGFEPVVASMGTALTERQLRELGRLTQEGLSSASTRTPPGRTRRCAGWSSRPRRGSTSRSSRCRAGRIPADAPDGFEERLGGAESYLLYRVRLELDRSADRQEGFVRAREVLAKAEDSPERQEALRLVADRLDLPRETLSGLAPAGASAGRRRRTLLRACSRRAIGSSATRSPPASRTPRSCEASRSSVPSTSTPTSTQRFRAALVSGREDRRADRVQGRAGRPRGAGGDRRADRTRASAPAARAEAEARSLGRRSRAHDGAAGASRQGAPGDRGADMKPARFLDFPCLTVPGTS